MKLTALCFAASIAVAIAYPARRYYGPVSYDEEEYSGGKNLWAAQPSYTLASAPFYFQQRTLEVDDTSRGRKYQVVKKKKHPGGLPSRPSDEEEDEPQDEEDESSEEDDDEEADEEESMDVPPWEELFPEEDKNTGSFDDQQGGPQGGGYGGQGGQGGPQGGYGGQGGQGGPQGGYGGQGGQGGPQGGYGGQGGPGGQGGGSLAGIRGGAPAPESSGSIMDFFTGGSGGSSGGPSGGSGGPPQQQGDIGGPNQYRQGPPPHYKGGRGRATVPGRHSEEPRAGGTVLYDGYQYIPVNPVHVQLQQRQAKKIKTKTQKVTGQGRSLTSRRTKQPTGNKKYVLVPVQQRDNRELRFSRDEEGFRVDSGPLYGPPTDVWRWERPLPRRENRQSGPLYYAPRPQRGSSSSVRFAEENDY